MKRDKAGRLVLVLTARELDVLSEAVRYSQQAHAEDAGDDEHLDPTLSRIQRKLGEEPHA
jgi:hypothetical protein